MYVCEKNACTGCMACLNICPQKAIRIRRSVKGFDYPVISKKKCVNCGLCHKVCQAQTDTVSDRSSAPAPTFYGAKAPDDIRFDSSSGGSFSLLAEQILSEGGAVCAARLDEDMVVRHHLITEPHEIATLRKTKYVQSDISKVYRGINELLSQNRPVLFVGTPCQCEGIKRYIELTSKGSSSVSTAKTEKLFLAALICYGAPSPGIWRLYVRGLELKHFSRLTSFQFRDKRKHDSGHSVSYSLKGLGGKTTEHTGSLFTNRYCSMYFHNKIIRENCYSCAFCTPDRNFDLTLGDFWGIEKVAPEKDDGMGISVIIIHSKKGNALLDAVKDRFSDLFEVSREQCLQPRLKEPTKKK